MILIYNFRDILRMGAAASVYKDELYGDATQTIALCEFYNKLLSMQQSEISMVKYKKEPISDKRFRQHLNLPADDPHFTSFNAYVNDACQKAVTDLYGKFSPLSSPILTQALLSSFASRFKRTLPTQHKAIMCFLNKEGSIHTNRVKKNLFLWDRYALYIFCMLMRIRNSRNFL